ncbi:hypothetical protein [Alterisphingorhabdus coralli]|uniref:Alginate export domain-containing protein n=1 Tax=Alterisphingorhabdus coralli TaxID=3071408 RepID=A0AA97F7J8_9SPHN|nr:hypothetical protein [Parasphingorhabdus sp. SCSIO 66989]WOE74722.1 hypothetical protein RB602_12840 [Parasphingorhabdus sp. SCSIO 66989]
MTLAAGLLSLIATAPMMQAEPPVAEPEQQVQQGEAGPDAEDALIDGRRRPGVEKELPDPIIQDNPGAVRAPPPEAFPTDDFPVPDRWRLIESLGVVKERWFDPYHQNTYKGDRPICIPTDEEQARRKAEGKPRCATPKFLGLKSEGEWFFVANAISDTVVEPRSFPIPVGVQTTERPGSNDVFGRADSLVLAQTFITGFALIKGSTAYKPPDVEYRLTLATQVNHVDVPERRVLFVEPSRSSNRTDYFIGVQEAFVDYHFRNTSDRYDFDSGRIGIQPMQADFRGFLFQDNQLGVRLFGTRDNNRVQYNLGAFMRLEKDTNSGLNDVTQTPRSDYVFFANLYRQDFPVVGLTSQVSVTYNMNREAGDIEIDDNGFPVRPALLGDLRGRDYDVVYLGYAVDGRIGRLNLTGQLYGAFGEDRNSIFTSRPADIAAWFAAAELSYDVDFMRFRLSGLFASGDSDPENNTEAGFDAIFENPIFAGADTSYWIRQTIPFAGGGRAVSINGRNGILNSLRSSKEQGQSNFNNPGTILLGAGADFDLTPEIRLSGNANHLWFDDTATLQALRNEGSIPNAIGWDLSMAAIWRPKATQNIVFRLSGAVFDPSDGFADLFTQAGNDDRYYSVLFNAIFAF